MIIEKVAEHAVNEHGAENLTEAMEDAIRSAIRDMGIS
jgi:predicted small metal-binding protein